MTDDTSRVIFTYYSRPESLGRRSFSIAWFQGGFWRSQHFFAKPEPFVAEERAEGKVIEEHEHGDGEGSS